MIRGSRRTAILGATKNEAADFTTYCAWCHTDNRALAGLRCRQGWQLPSAPMGAHSRTRRSCLDSWILLAGAGLVAGIMNAVAGGGTFVTLPALIFAGVPSVAANATSTVALFPGTLASAYAYRREFRSFGSIEGNVDIRTLLGISAMGGLVGALLLLFTPNKSFDAIVPWLMLLGTLAFAFGPQLSVVLRRHFRIGRRTMMACQFVLSIYGGYFGGAVGVMLMACWSLLGMTDLLAMNAAKTLLVTAMNTVAAICFAVAGLVWWPQALAMMAASVVGGYLGASVARRLNQAMFRRLVSALYFALTAAFFWRSFAA